MWNRIDHTLPNNSGFDTDKVLQFRDRLIIILVDDCGKQQLAEAYVHNGVWHYWDQSLGLVKDKILVWTEFPHFGEYHGT